MLSSRIRFGRPKTIKELLDRYVKECLHRSMKSDETHKTKFVRVWTKISVDEIKKQILYVDDLYGTCGNCKKLGLNYLKDRSCPDCKTTFRYMATNSKNPSEIAKMLARMEKENIPFTLIDREDFERSSARDAAMDLFKS